MSRAGCSCWRVAEGEKVAGAGFLDGEFKGEEVGGSGWIPRWKRTGGGDWEGWDKRARI